MTHISLNYKMDKQKWYMRTIEYYSAIKINKLLICAIWMNLKSILSDRSLT